jgi:tRNA modification GTPase
MQDTIAAPATAPGSSVRAMIRVSGPRAGALASALTGVRFEQRCLRRVCLRLGVNELPALMAWFEGGASYTGEPAFEVLIPGNPTLISRVMARLTAFKGVRVAGPGEFTARAYVNGRLTLAQAEGVGALVAASNQEQRRIALMALDGSMGAEYRAWADELLTLEALVEAGIDFTDQEDVIPSPAEALRRRLSVVGEAIASRIGSSRGRDATTERVRVVLKGPPNAGKSTLFNRLLGRSRVIESPMAGSTRDVIDEPLTLPDGSVVTLIDLPGLDAAPMSPSEIASQANAVHALGQADLILDCQPGGVWEGQPEPNVIRVRTCADQPGGAAQGAMEVCALDGRGLPELLQAITDAAWGRGHDAATRGSVLGRHQMVLRGVLIHVQGALHAVGSEAVRVREPELVAESLRGALDVLGELLGTIDVEAILGRIFSTFCVGK